MPDETVNYFDQPLRRFLEDTAARQPTPGGGSVAALSAVLGCNVARMVCAYTLANAKLAAAHPAVSKINEKLARCAEMLRRLVAEDMDAYTAYAAAQRDKSAAAEAVARRRAATIAAVAVPLEITVLAASALRACDEIQADASKYLLSDLLAVLFWPPPTVAQLPLAVLPRPPPTVASDALAVFAMPPPTVA